MVSDDFSQRLPGIFSCYTFSTLLQIWRDTEAALYRRPNLRLAARPGRRRVQGREDRYQPLSVSQSHRLDTTLHVTLIHTPWVNIHHPIHPAHTSTWSPTFTQSSLFSLLTHATSVPVAADFSRVLTPLPLTQHSLIKHIKTRDPLPVFLSLCDPAATPGLTLRLQTVKEDIITLMLHCVSPNTLSRLIFNCCSLFYSPGFWTHSWSAFWSLRTWRGLLAMSTSIMISRNSSSPASHSCCTSSPPEK